MNTVSTHKNPDFWIFGLFFFLYFFIMATCFPFLPVWLSDIVGLSKTDTGIVFSCLSLFAISFQPLLGVISDRLGLKKHLMWIISLLLVLFAPFFLYVFAPLLFIDGSYGMRNLILLIRLVQLDFSRIGQCYVFMNTPYLRL